MATFRVTILSGVEQLSPVRAGQGVSLEVDATGSRSPTFSCRCCTLTAPPSIRTGTSWTRQRGRHSSTRPLIASGRSFVVAGCGTSRPVLQRDIGTADERTTYVGPITELMRTWAGSTVWAVSLGTVIWGPASPPRRPSFSTSPRRPRWRHPGRRFSARLAFRRGQRPDPCRRAPGRLPACPG